MFDKQFDQAMIKTLKKVLTEHGESYFHKGGRLMAILNDLQPEHEFLKVNRLIVLSINACDAYVRLKDISGDQFEHVKYVLENILIDNYFVTPVMAKWVINLWVELLEMNPKDLGELQHSEELQNSEDESLPKAKHIHTEMYQRECDSVQTNKMNSNKITGVPVSYQKVVDEYLKKKTGSQKATESDKLEMIYSEPTPSEEFQGKKLQDEKAENDTIEPIKKNLQDSMELSKSHLKQSDQEQRHRTVKGTKYDKKDVKRVFLLTQAAEKGNAEAQTNLGDCYYIGSGITQSYSQAIKWYEKSAEQGNVNAQYNLGNCYYAGTGVEKDYKKAVQWLKKAAAQGHSVSQNNLGVCYCQGEGVPQDYQKAEQWFIKAAEQGNTMAEDNLENLRKKKH